MGAIDLEMLSQNISLLVEPFFMLGIVLFRKQYCRASGWRQNLGKVLSRTVEGTYSNNGI